MKLGILLCQSNVRFAQSSSELARVDILVVVAKEDDLFALQFPRAEVFEEASVGFQTRVTVVHLFTFELSRALRKYCLSAFFGAACCDLSLGLWHTTILTGFPVFPVVRREQ